MTERLYYTDSYLKAFEAGIVKIEPASSGYHVYLDRTAFYPTSGGQPFDLGHIAGVPVVDVLDEGNTIAHVVATEPPGGRAACEIDWVCRFDHMQQHTGQHLLSAVLIELFGFSTVSFHLGAEASTIDIAAAELTPAQIEAAEERANTLVFENRPVEVSFYSPEDAVSIGLRKPSEREGPVRVVEISGVDRSACGGTHVRATGEIGPVQIRKLDRVRQTVRVEFVCGGRAVRRARTDYRALAQIAQLFSAPLDQVVTLVAAQLEGAKSAGKTLQKLEAELAAFKGRELYRDTTPDERGRRVYQGIQRSGPIEPWRLIARHFTDAGPGALFVVTVEDPPVVLVALSADWDANAGALVKSVAGALGGRGGGNARLAQASLPNALKAVDAARMLVGMAMAD